MMGASAGTAGLINLPNESKSNVAGAMAMRASSGFGRISFERQCQRHSSELFRIR